MAAVIHTRIYEWKDLIVIFMLSVVLILDHCETANVVQTWYVNRVDYVPDGSPSTAVNITARSKIQCALFCNEIDWCLTFLFTKTTHTCEVSNTVISSGGSVYGAARYCPTGRGYKMYKSAEFVLCLKIVGTRVQQPTGKHDCSVDGGHLASIDNEQKRLFVMDILASVGSGTVWIDGEDTNTNGTFVNWKGEASFLAWIPTEPTGLDSYCLMMSAGNAFLFSDFQCYAERGYVCEID